MDNDNVCTTIIDPSVSRVLITAALATLTCFIIAYKWKCRHLEKLAAQLPGPYALPIIGNALVCLGAHEKVFQRLFTFIKTYGSVYRLWLGPVLLIHVSNPEDIQIILSNPKALNKGELYRFLKSVVGNGLVTAPVEIWRTHRRMIAPAFNMRLLEQFVPIFYKHNMELMDKLRPHVDKDQFDIWKYISWTNLGMIFETAFGLDERIPHKLKSELAEAVERLTELIGMRIFKVWLQSDFIFYQTSYGTEFMKYIEQAHRLANKVIEEKRKELKLKKEIESEQNKDIAPNLKVFIDILMELSEDGVKLTDDDLRDEVITMIVAGHDTTAQTICFCLLMLAIHQDIQEKVYEELFGIFGDSDREVTLGDLKQMTYTEMVIKETLRRYPTVPAILRSTEEDIDLMNHTLPAGCNVLITPITLHMDPKVFPNPEKFNPENFTPERIAERHRYSYIPFSQGSRSCVGQVYAMLSMKTSMACLIRNYKFFTDMKMEDIEVKLAFLLRCCTGHPIRIVHRKWSKQDD